MKIIKSITKQLGYEVLPGDYLQKLNQKITEYEQRITEYEQRNALSYSDFSEYDKEIISHVKSYTMTSPERVVSLINAIKYIYSNRIEGDIVECGVWRGGSMMVVAKTLLNLKLLDKSLFLYDTYEGMSEPSDKDVSFDGFTAKSLLDEREKKEDDYIWCYSTLEEVKNNLFSTGYDQNKINFIVGKVEDTIPDSMPKKIALLRLDTDWYESTYHELEHLFPLLQNGGVIIIDDYGHWQGARRATDDYIKNNNIKILLNRIDYTGRIGVKTT